MRYLLASAILALAAGNCVQAQDKGRVVFIAEGAMKAPVEQLIPEFERRTGYHVKATFSSGPGAKQQVVKGTPFDVAVIEPPYPEVIASGNLEQTSGKPLASVSLGVAVRAGAPRPVISTPEALKHALLAVNSVSFPNPALGAETGQGFMEALKKLGIQEQMEPKFRPKPGGRGETVTSVADGEVEMAVTFISEITQPGVEVVGTLPREVAPPMGLVGFVSGHAQNPEGARALLDYLASAEAAAAYKAHRMQPPLEVSLIAPGGMKAAVERLIPGFEQKTGYKVNATFGSGKGTKAQVAKGAPFDVPIVQPPYPEVTASGNVVAASETTLASVAVGLAVRKGAPRPDISTPDAVKRTLLAAKSVAYPNPVGGATAGANFEAMLRKLGIADEMQPKLKRAQGGAGAMAMVAKGEAEIGATFVTEMSEPGAELVGILPKEILPPTVLVGFVSTHAADPAAAKSLVEYLSSPDAARIYQTLHMQPGR